MKTKIFTLVLLTILFALNANAQINLVSSTGNLALGDITDPSVYKIAIKYGNVALFGCGQNGYGSRLFKLGAGTNSYNCFSVCSYNLPSGLLKTRLGVNYDVNGNDGGTEYATLGSKYAPAIELNAETGSISLYGENGPLGSNNRLATHNIGVYVQNNGYIGINNLSPSCALDISGVAKANGVVLTSDSRLKENIVNLKNPLDSLFLMQGVTYNLKWPVVQSTNSSRKDSIGRSSSNANVDSSLYSRRHVGFIAQDIQKIFPELVYADKNGILSIDYIGIIPLLVEGLKQQQQIITAQSTKLKELDARLTKIENKNTQTQSVKSDNLADLTTPNLSNASTNSFLYQNIPNPFSVQTEIKYYIPEDARNGSLLIFNMQGSLIKSMIISAFGSGSQTINGSELHAGMYIYTLIVDSKEVDTKRMILTE
jgi:Chaperone of endosialidase/Secretion system C-terminal sorting domain